MRTPTGQRTALTSRERVLKAATALFAAKGFHLTSTREVARRARVNEITIFRLFKNKQQLYVQVLDRELEFPLAEWFYECLQPGGDLECGLVKVLESLERLLDPVFLRLVFYTAMEKPELLGKQHRPRLAAFQEVLGGHIRKQIESGVLRDIEPALMGRALIGIIAYHQIVCQLLGDPDFPGCREGLAEIYADIWLRGALAWEAPARQNRAEKPLRRSDVSARDGGQFNT
jgi:AcrR family transcriptional regulator